MGFFSELWEFAKTRKKLILLPIILVSLMVGFLVVFAGGSVVSPFLYTLF
ncbi:MAG: DUF5989 family protein [Bdellovibrionota bacterium]